MQWNHQVITVGQHLWLSMFDNNSLSHLDPHTFAHLVNSLALRELGAGLSEFGPGSDGGRDGYFEGKAPYPSSEEQWSGIWYIQSKFHRPSLSRDSQKWLLNEITSELTAFKETNSKRKWPDIWIVATNIDPSGVPESGAFDASRKIVQKARSKLSKRFHIWGGAKILKLLVKHPDIADRFGHFLTPGNILTQLNNALDDGRATVKAILQHLIAKQFNDNRLTKLEQAGSQADARPTIHQLFIDLPFICKHHNLSGDA
jgi:hypothetical protein